MLQAELDEHLGYENIVQKAAVQVIAVMVLIRRRLKRNPWAILLLIFPRDRNSEFEPQLIPKGQRMIDKLEEAIIGMYSRGMTTFDIRDQVKEVYDQDVSEGTIPMSQTGLRNMLKADKTVRLNQFILLYGWMALFLK